MFFDYDSVKVVKRLRGYQVYPTQNGKVACDFQVKRTSSIFQMVFNPVTGNVDQRLIREAYIGFYHEAGSSPWRY
jgi:hypothetical protein